MANFFKAAKAKALTKLDIAKGKLSKNSPELMIGAGLVLTTVSIVLFCKKTLNTPEIIDDHKLNMAEVNEHVEKGDMTHEEAKKEKFGITKQTVFRIAGNYILPFMGYAGGTILVIGGAVKGKNKRNELSADLGAALSAFAMYRDRIRDRLGEEAEADIYYDRHSFDYTEMKEDGTVETKKAKSMPGRTGHPLEFCFNSLTSSKFEEGELGTKYNFALLKSELAAAQDELTAPWGGRPIRLNYILGRLGLKEEGKWDNYGWLPDELGGTVQKISFGLEKYSDGDKGMDIPIDGEIILEFNAEFISDKY